MPSEKILEQKKQIVSDLTEQLKGACAGVLVSYKGISVEMCIRDRLKTERQNCPGKSNIEHQCAAAADAFGFSVQICK